MKVSTRPEDVDEQSATDESDQDRGSGTTGPQTLEGVRPTGVVRARDVRFAYRAGSPVLRGVDLEIGVGEIVAVVGPKGAGKSTLLRIFAGDLEATEGEVDLPARRSGAGRVMLGYAGHEESHFEELSGWDNAVFFARVGGMRRVDAQAAVTQLFETFDLAEQADVPVRDYSDEDRRRLLLVEALAHQPALAVLDDPFLGLPQRTREALIHSLRLHAAQRGTVVVASEDLTLIPELADRILFLHRGRIVAGGRVAELLASVGSATRLELELERRPDDLDARFRGGIDVVSDGDPYVVEVSRGRAAMGEVLAALTAAGATVQSVTVREPDLAEAFRRATGEELQP
jgi:ABC-2 type transport system ATP-binding protein